VANPEDPSDFAHMFTDSKRKADFVLARKTAHQFVEAMQQREDPTATGGSCTCCRLRIRIQQQLIAIPTLFAEKRLGVGLKAADSNMLRSVLSQFFYFVKTGMNIRNQRENNKEHDNQLFKVTSCCCVQCSHL